MNQREIWIVVSVTLLIIITFVAVAFFASNSSPIKEKSTHKRFSAAAGKTREKPLLLVSKKREDTFDNKEEKKEKTEPPSISKIYSSQLGNNEGEDKNISLEGRSEEKEETNKETVDIDISDDLKQLLQTSPDNQQISQENIQETLNNWMDSVSSQEKKIEVLRNHLEVLILKGLSEWVTGKMEEIIGQTKEDKVVLSEAQWLLGQIKSIQGDMIIAEQCFQQAWQNITSSADLNDPKKEELFRLLGLDYVQLLRKQNKNEEAETVINSVSEKLKAKVVIKD